MKIAHTNDPSRVAGNSIVQGAAGLHLLEIAPGLGEASSTILRRASASMNILRRIDIRDIERAMATPSAIDQLEAISRLALEAVERIRRHRALVSEA